MNTPCAAFAGCLVLLDPAGFRRHPAGRLAGSVTSHGIVLLTVLLTVTAAVTTAPGKSLYVLRWVPCPPARS